LQSKLWYKILRVAYTCKLPIEANNRWLSIPNVSSYAAAAAAVACRETVSADLCKCCIIVRRAIGVVITADTSSGRFHVRLGIKRTWISLQYTSDNSTRSAVAFDQAALNILKLCIWDIACNRRSTQVGFWLFTK